MQMPFGDRRTRERLALALMGSTRSRPDAWPFVAAICAGVAIGTVVGVLLSQSGTQRQLTALTGWARDVGGDLVGRARPSQTTVLEESQLAAQTTARDQVSPSGAAAVAPS
jgi:hypothetical protein